MKLIGLKYRIILWLKGGEWLIKQDPKKLKNLLAFHSVKGTSDSHGEDIYNI